MVPFIVQWNSVLLLFKHCSDCVFLLSRTLVSFSVCGKIPERGCILKCLVVYRQKKEVGSYIIVIFNNSLAATHALSDTNSGRIVLMWFHSLTLLYTLVEMHITSLCPFSACAGLKICWISKKDIFLRSNLWSIKELCWWTV